MKLYVKSLSLDIKYTIDQLTLSLFDLKDTPYASNVNISTYGDPNFRTRDNGSFIEHSYLNKRTYRSVGDLLIIYNTYRKHTTLAEMLLSIEKYILKDRFGMFIFCPDVRKWVLHNGRWTGHNGSKYIYMFNYKNSNHYYDEVGDGKHSYREILNYMGISKDYRRDINIINKSNKIEDADNGLSVSV